MKPIGSIPSFEELGDMSSLLCPKCSFSGLHHDKVDVYARQCEDDGGVAVSVFSQTEDRLGGVVAVSPIKDHAIGRRDAIVIRFWCEGCSAKPSLTIRQHKGETQMSWQSEG